LFWRFAIKRASYSLGLKLPRYLSAFVSTSAKTQAASPVDAGSMGNNGNDIQMFDTRVVLMVMSLKLKLEARRSILQATNSSTMSHPQWWWSSERRQHQLDRRLGIQPPAQLYNQAHSCVNAEHRCSFHPRSRGCMVHDSKTMILSTPLTIYFLQRG
jgi:hypothetical protein